jgi:ssDNA-binding Zn-finger/Zn-ribbon topoisomerase 1
VDTKGNVKENTMEKQIFAVGERADKLCAKCQEERGHIVTSVTKRGHISRVTCPKCGTLSTFKSSSRTSPRVSVKIPSPYDRTRVYRSGQTMTHQTFGIGEVTKLIEPAKIDVLFEDRLRRLIHAQV